MADTIPGLLAEAANRDAAGIWLRTDDGFLSFGGAAARVAAVADALAAAGVRRGDLVVLTARATAPYLLCWLALTSLGAIAVAVNPQAATAELAGLIRQTKPRALITDAHPLLPSSASTRSESGVPSPGSPSPGLSPPGLPPPGPPPQEILAVTVASAVAASVRPAIGTLDVAELAGDWAAPQAADAADAAAGSARLTVVPGPDDIAALIPTSGTTGRSKLVIQTHRAYAMAGEGFPYWLELTATDRLMTALPLFHVNAPAYSVLGSLACGAGLVLLPRFSASGFLAAARRHGATEFNAIGAMLEILMRQPEHADDASTPLRLCYTGPAPTRERQEQIERRFGLRIVCGYALSETPYGLVWPRGTRPFGTLGAPRQHPRLGTVNEARVVAADGTQAGPGGTGELLLRNPALTPGYWQMPAETAELITDGWLHTGDLVTVNTDGTYTFVARRKEVLRRRGENLSPLEVEEVLLGHPAVLDCAVVGLPAELSEDEIKAFVVAAPGQRLDLAELRAWAAARLTAFKVPRYWQVMGELPRTPTARVAKHRLPAGHPPGEYDSQAGQPGRPDRPAAADAAARPAHHPPG